jgi:hypothetical protein
MSQPASPSSADVDNSRRNHDDRRMDDRLAIIETDLATLKADVGNMRANYATREDAAAIRATCATKDDVARLGEELATLRARSATKDDVARVSEELATIRVNYATKEDVVRIKVDLLEAMNAQTWKFVTWMTGAMAMMLTAVYFVARDVH